ncbi:MAG TPA: tyrosine-type recombinase/integrase [Bryobacteraceae bacterium]|nr:tyrosine-type recombinase/integrase [Bryobacteraceae bacterium]
MYKPMYKTWVYTEAMLNPYRRHLPSCKHAAKGQTYTRCSCPIWVYGTLPTGEKVRYSLKSTDWDKANRAIDRMEFGEVRPLKTGQGKTVSDTIEAFITDAERRELRASTIISYRRTFHHLSVTFTDTPVAGVTLEALEEWARTRKGKTDEPLTPRTAAKEIEHVRALFRFALDHGWIARNPADKLRKPKTPRTPGTLPFTSAELRKLFQAVETFGPKHQRKDTVPRIRALVLVLLHSGLRISDVARLTRNSIDWRTGHVSVIQTKTGIPVRVKLSAEVLEALDKLPDSMFRQGDGNPKTIERTLQRSLHRLGANAGVHVHPHRFRDTFAVELLTVGADIRTVQLLLGHDSLRTTEKHYAHFVPEHQGRLDAATAGLKFGRAGKVETMKKTGTK